MADGETPENPPIEQPRVRFHYIKSPEFRTIHADGGIGGPTPGGQFHLALYAERFPIPTLTEHEARPEGPGPEIREARVARDGIVRELQVDVVFDYRTAQSLLKWLQERIELWQQMTGMTEKDTGPKSTESEVE
jgi:hypothetical protein